VGGEVVPRLRVAEEIGDVDEDRVEQLDELVRVRLEIVLIPSKVVDAQLLHTTADAADQARSFVSGEVETACGFQELKERFEAFVGLFGVHAQIPLNSIERGEARFFAIAA
jgi:hypothetical protein